MLVLRILDLAEHRALVEPQHVRGAEYDAAGGETGPDFVRDEHALEDEELADEAVQRRQADRGHRHDQKNDGVGRHHLRQTAILGDLTRMAPLVDVADQQEERAGRDAMVELLNDAPHDANRVEREHAQHDHGHVTHARVRHEALPVLLRHRAQRAVHDADNRKRHHHRDEMPCRIRQYRQREADEAVGAHLQQNSRQDDGAGCRRVRVRVGQPGVERKHRHLDREPEEKREEHPPLQVERHVHVLELRDVEGVHAGDAVAVEVEPQNAEQHDDAADEGVQEKFDRRVQPPVASPDADEEIHRHEHDLPEQEEQQEVEADERSHHACLEDEQKDVVLLHALGNRRPRGKNRDGPEQGGQQHEQRAEAVDAQEVLRAHRGNPGHPLHELIAGVLDVVPEPQRHGDEESGQREEVCDQSDRAAVLFGDEHQHCRAEKREEQNYRQKRKAGGIRHGITSRANKCSPKRTRLPASAARSSEQVRSGPCGTRSSIPRTTVR